MLGLHKPTLCFSEYTAFSWGWGWISGQREWKKMRLMCKIEFLHLWGDNVKWCFYHIWPDHRCIGLKLLLAGLIPRLKEKVGWLLPRMLPLEVFETFSEQCTLRAKEVKAVFMTKYLWLLILHNINDTSEFWGSRCCHFDIRLHFLLKTLMWRAQNSVFRKHLYSFVKDFDKADVTGPPPHSLQPPNRRIKSKDSQIRKVFFS